MITADGSFFAYLVDSLLPLGGYVVAYASAYMDESYGHPGSDVLCVAGFRFERDGATRLDQEWRAVLRRERMPYMRMSLFTKDDQEPYAHLSRKQRVEIGKELISIIQKYRTLAFISGVSEGLFARVWPEYFPPHYVEGGGQISPYTWCLNDCMKFVGKSILNEGFIGKIAFFFESGHKHMAQANAVLNENFRSEQFRQQIHYGSHTFIDKTESGALQAADMLAWLAGNYFKKGLPGSETKMRKDLRALIEMPGSQYRLSLHWWNEERLRFYLGTIVDIHRASFWRGASQFFSD